MKFYLIILFFFISVLLSAQRIRVIKIADLQNRINNSGDTTYVVNFWATWCAPCVKELPDFDSIAKISGNLVKVLFVTLDFKEDLETKVIPFLRKKPLHSEVMLLDEVNGNYFIPKISDQWTGSIPATLIVNNKTKYKQFYEKKLSFTFLKDEIGKSLIQN
jgi:thiol-disulfide isomerase/thioredoxin